MEYLKLIFTLENILMMNVGVLAGIIIGALPGLSVVLAITVLLPFTFSMEPLPAIYLLLGAYCAGNYGGSVTAIMVNTPGTPAAAATVLDGYPMARKGRAAEALGCSLAASTFGGLFSAAVLFFAAPVIADFAMLFGPADFFSLCIFGLAVVVSIGSNSVVKGLTMVGIGLLLSTVGIDPIEGLSRFRFGFSELIGGFEIAAVMLGMFAISEILFKVRDREQGTTVDETVGKTQSRLFNVIRRYWRTMLRSSAIGTFIGAVPGTGAPMAAFFSYNLTQSTSKHPETFGQGDPEGVVAPEAANNAVSGGALVPMLTLGIPGDTCTAILLGALTMQGISPGPQLFTSDKYWVYCLMLGLIVENIFMYMQGIYFTKIIAYMTRVPSPVLVTCMAVFCVLGAYSIRNYIFDVLAIMIFGFFGYWFRRFEYPIAPLAIGLVLGKLLEVNLRRAMVMSKGSIAIFFTEPISLVFFIIAAVFLLRPLLAPLWRNIKAHKKAS